MLSILKLTYIIIKKLLMEDLSVIREIQIHAFSFLLTIKPPPTSIYNNNDQELKIVS